MKNLAKYTILTGKQTDTVAYKAVDGPASDGTEK